MYALVNGNSRRLVELAAGDRNDRDTPPPPECVTCANRGFVAIEAPVDVRLRVTRSCR